MSNRGDCQRRSPASGRQVKRPLFHIGPGILIALALAVIIGANVTRTARQRRHAPRSAPPIIEGRVISSDFDKAGPVPEVGFLIDRREKLRLSDRQTESLRKLQAEWGRFYQPKLREAKAASRQMTGYLSRSRTNGRTPVQQIEERAAPVVAVSREISATRRQYWDRAMKLLTPEQRRIAAKEREADYAAKRRALAEALRKRPR